MQMQKLRKPPHRRILSSLQRLLLLHIALITPYSEPVRRTGKILIVVLEIQAGDHAIRVRFQLRVELRIMLRSNNLNRNINVVDFLLCQKRRVGRRDAIDQVFPFGAMVSLSIPHS